MYFRPIFDLFYPHPPKPTFDLFLTYFNVFGVSGPLGGLCFLTIGSPLATPDLWRGPPETALLQAARCALRSAEQSTFRGEEKCEKAPREGEGRGVASKGGKKEKKKKETRELLREAEPGEFPTFLGKVQIVSRTFSGLFLVGALILYNRPRKRKGTNRENPRTIPEQISGKSRKNRESPKRTNKEGQVQIGKPPRLEPPRLAALETLMARRFADKTLFS